MAVAFDAVGPSSAGAGAAAAASLTWSHTCGGTANAIVASGVQGLTITGRTLTATYAGVTMTPGTAVTSGSGSTTGQHRVFTLLNPTTGANNVVVTCTGGSGDLTGGSVSMTGAGSFQTQYSAQGNVTSPATATSAGSASGGLIAAFVCCGDSVTSATAPSTSRYIKNLNFNSSAGNSAGATSPSTGSNVTTAWAIANPDNWAVIGVEVLQAAAAAVLPILVMAPPQ